METKPLYLCCPCYHKLHAVCWVRSLHPPSLAIARQSLCRASCSLLPRGHASNLSLARCRSVFRRHLP